MNYILFDDSTRYQLLPFTHTRPIADIRCGIVTMRKRWEHFLKQSNTGTLTEEYLQAVFPQNSSDDNIFVNGSIFANNDIAEAILKLKPQESLVKGDLIIATRITNSMVSYGANIQIDTTLSEIAYQGQVKQLQHIWDIFSYNGAQIQDDFKSITEGRGSQPIPEGVTIAGTENIFIEEGAEIGVGCIINGTKGPVYIGKNAHILEGAIIRGPIAICENAVVKMGAKMYSDTTVGPGCKVGGEISNVVFFANSNKGHDGYLGNAVIGEWCNLGADTNSSNLKNNYAKIKIWDEHNFKAIETGLTFCGLMMGDHSKCGINTMFNTATVVGVSANIYGAGFPKSIIPSFSWGGSESMTTYKLERALDTAGRMMERRNLKLSDAEIKMYEHIFALTEKQRDIFANKLKSTTK